MRSLSRITTVSTLALSLAAALAVVPAGAQEVRRPMPHGAAPHGVGASRPTGFNRGAAPHALSAPIGPAQAQGSRRGGNGAGVAAGVIGGLAAGAILGGILSNRGAVAEPDPELGPGRGCPLVRRAVYDGAGQFAGYQTVPSC